MVRLDKCVEALYDDSVTNDSRNKNMQMLNVMKGAISVSRSRTGECIFRTNKAEKKNLERVLLCEGRDSTYKIAEIDSKRKQVLVRWSKVLEQQTMCSSETLFEELMELNSYDDADSHKITLSESPDHDDGKLKHLIDLRLSAIEKETNAGTYVPVVPRRRRLKADGTKATSDELHNEFVTVDKQIRDTYTDGQADDKVQAAVTETEVPADDVRGKAKLVHLPVIRQEKTTASKTSEQSPRPLPLDRDLTDWGNWGLKDKSWIKGYLFREKTRHEDLIIRNALNKIETEMSGANMIKRQQMRQKLQQERQHREAEVRHQMRAQKSSEASGDYDLTSPRARRETTASEKLDPSTLDKEKDIAGETDEQASVSSAQTTKHVNFDEHLMVHVFESSGKRRAVPKGTRRTKKSRARHDFNTTCNLSLPIIPENAKTVKKGTQLKGRN